MISPALDPTHLEADSDRSAAEAAAPKREGRRSTSHLKLVPPTLEGREQIKHAAEAYTRSLDKSRPFTRAQLETHGRQLLSQLELPEGYLGFAMVLIGNFFWKRQFL